jgi:UDP-N-acetyl-D-glucosamine dehydrogenase
MSIINNNKKNYLNLLIKIKKKKFKIGIIGLGYVGLPLALRFIEKGINVYGIDSDLKKILSLRKGKTYIKSINSKKLNYFKKNKKNLSNHSSILLKCDVIIICLPTPLKKNKNPNLEYIFNALKKAQPHLKKFQTIVLESTVYPGTTRKFIKFIKNNFKLGESFFLGYSPERENPGDKKFSYKTTPKVISGYSKNCLKIINNVYSFIARKRILADTLEVAETSKLLENLYRSINIGLVNELKIVCDRLKIDPYEVIKVASTKNFGFQKFLPGPGLGGHCIPIDPYYLSWISKKNGYDPKLIKASGEINSNIPNWIFKKMKQTLGNKKNINILIIGISYKKNIDDDRESPAFEIMKILLKNKINFEYSDPFFKKIRKGRNINIKKKSVKINQKTLKKFSAALIVADHDQFDYNFISKNSKIVFDSRNIYKNKKYNKCKNIVFV